MEEVEEEDQVEVKERDESRRSPNYYKKYDK